MAWATLNSPKRNPRTCYARSLFDTNLINCFAPIVRVDRSTRLKNHRCEHSSFSFFFLLSFFLLSFFLLSFFLLSFFLLSFFLLSFFLLSFFLLSFFLLSFFLSSFFLLEGSGKKERKK